MMTTGGVNTLCTRVHALWYVKGLQLAIPPPIESTRSTETGYVPIIWRTGMSRVEIPRHLITILIKSGVYVGFEKLNLSTSFKRTIVV